MGDRAGALGRGVGEQVPVRPAATLMVVRDGDHPSAPLEVLMVRRSLRSDFAGGAYVFPGGAVDPDDSSPRLAARCDGATDAGASAVLDLVAGGLAYWIAAIRECFEEAGVLFARRRTGEPLLALTDPSEVTRFAHHRDELNAGQLTFLELCEAEGLVLATDTLHYFSHWITPEGGNRRYDTRFFVADAPLGQTPEHNAGETISDVWVRPADALAQHRAGDIDLILPTVRSLQAIGRFVTVAELLGAVSRISHVPALLPRMVADSHGWRVLLPGDPGYDDAVLPQALSDFGAVELAISRAANPAPAGGDGAAGAPAGAPADGPEPAGTVHDPGLDR